MTNLTFTSLTALAMNAEAGTAPEWIQLIPAGPAIQGRDGRGWQLPDPQTVVDAFNQDGGELPVDFEHATQVRGQEGMPAPAVGWVKELAVRNGEIWARVEWNEEGQHAVASKGYRYVSPVFTFTKAAKTISRMVSVGLTNQPNLKLAALNKEGDQEEIAMNKAILEALGLTEDASDQDVLQAINTLKQSEETAKNRADTPDPTRFVPRADYELAQNKLRTFETAETERQEEAINSAVDAAIEAGKVAPASRDYHVAACKSEGGLENFQKLVEATPELAGKSGLDDKDVTEKNTTQLSDDELAVCRAMGISKEDYLAQKAEDAKE